MLLRELAQTSASLATTRSRLKKADLLVACLRALPANEIRIGVAYLSGNLLQTRTGIGHAALQAAFATPAVDAGLTLTEVDRRLQDIAAIGGSGSQARRKTLLGELMARASADEQAFLRRLILGELRQGALEGLMVDALAAATELPLADVRRAAMFAGDIATVAEQTLLHGAAGLRHFRFELFRPLQPMLAQAADDTDEALGQLGDAVLDFKLDGARVQLHKDGETVRAFTRQLNDVTDSVPELVEQVRALPLQKLVLDGEAIALAKDGRPLPFQVTMKRFGRRLDVAAMRASLPLSVRFFDCLYADGDDLIDYPLHARLALLDDFLPAAQVIPRLITGDFAQATAFLDRALAAGYEGIMAKAPGSPYAAGSRGADWLKVKPVHTLDLVVLAAEWGSGRRQGKLSNLHLGARDPHNNIFVMLGKTFKGLTDRLLTWQTDALLAREIGRDGHIVHVRPELVVEIAFNDVQSSRQYPGGMALRFARVKRYRDDKSAAGADTIDSVRRIFEQGFRGAGK